MKQIRKTKNLFVLCLFLFTGIIAATQVPGHKKDTAAGYPDEKPDNEVLLDEDPWTDLQKIVDGFQSADGVTYSGTIKLIDENGSEQKLIEQSPFTYTLFNDEFYYSLSGVEIVSKKNFTLLVDHGSKTVAVTLKANADVKTAPFNVQAFQQLLDQRQAAIKLSQLDTERILTVDHILDPVIQGYRVYYAPTTYQVRKIEIGMARLNAVSAGKEEPVDTGARPDLTTPDGAGGNENAIETYTYYMEIEYKNVRKWTGKKETFLPENKFITGADRTVQLTDAFKSYTLLNAGNQ